MLDALLLRLRAPKMDLHLWVGSIRPSMGLEILEIGAWSLDVGASKLDNGASKSEIGTWKLEVAFWRPRNLLGDRVPDRAPGHW